MDELNDTNITYYNGSLENEVTSVIRLYLPPVLICLGFISNSVLFLVFGREKFKTFNVIVYIRVFAISNVVVLFLGVGIEWICYIVGHTGIFNLSDVVCRLWMFAMNVITHAPVWFVVSLSVDRFVYIWYPNKALDMCNFFIAKTVVVVSLTGLVAVSVHALWTFELKPGVGCYMPNIPSFHYIAWPWFSDSLFIFLPVLLLVVFCFADFIGLILQTPSFNSNFERQITFVVVLIATLFLCFETPAAIIKIIAATIPKSWLDDPSYVSSIFVGQAVCQILASLNQFILILVPVIWLPNFNREFANMLTSCRTKPFHRKNPHEVAFTTRTLIAMETQTDEQHPMTANI